MISRLSACAALFAVLATATLAYATETQAQHAAVSRAAAAARMDVVVLPSVTVIGRRAP